MKEHPILFKGEMVRAILDGRKTQTRRIIKPQSMMLDGGGHPFTQQWDQEEQMNFRRDVRCPYGVPGDRLWVKETWASQYYKADWGALSPGKMFYGKWSPSIFMPRAYSRLTLEVVEVRVQRLQDISEEDARAEGVEPSPPAHWYYKADTREKFAKLWDSINGKRAPWASNPWVWAITFKRAKP